MDPIREIAMPGNALELSLLGVGEYIQAPGIPFIRFDDYEEEFEDDFEEEDDFDDFSDEEDDFDDDEDDFDDDDDDDDDFDDDFGEGEEESADYTYEDDIDYNDFDE